MKTLDELGYTLVERGDEKLTYEIWENKSTDTKVTLDIDAYVPGYDDGIPVLHSETISTEKDWFGHEQHMPIGLDIYELMAFTERIKVLQEEWQ